MTTMGGAQFVMHASGQDAEPGWGRLLESVRTAAGDPEAAFRLADDIAAAIPGLGEGRTARALARLADLASVDLTVCRALEPHLDALSILNQAAACGYELPAVPPHSRWGVYAAEGPAGRLDGTLRAGGTVSLRGGKQWCSLAAVVSHALVTAWTAEDERTLCAIRLDDPGVRVVEDTWVARGLTSIVSGAIELDGVVGDAVGPPGWYLSRPGFAWGGVGVAACWFGGAAGLVRRLAAQSATRQPDQIALAVLGECDAALAAAAALLEHTAAEMDSGELEGPHAWPRVTRVRHVVHQACELVLQLVSETLGPSPLTQEEEHARRVADLQVYLRQHKGPRDAALVGRAILQGAPTAWGRV